MAKGTAKQPRMSLKNLISSHVSPKGEGGMPAWSEPAAAAPVEVASEPGAKGKAKKKPEKTVRYLQTRINDEGWRALKMLSVEENQPLQALFVEALNDLLRKYRKGPVVEGPSED